MTILLRFHFGTSIPWHVVDLLAAGGAPTPYPGPIYSWLNLVRWLYPGTHVHYTLNLNVFKFWRKRVPRIVLEDIFELYSLQP